MAELCRGEHFGIIGEYYNKREGNFKLFRLPDVYEHENEIIAVYRDKHLEAEWIKRLQQFHLQS